MGLLDELQEYRQPNGLYSNQRKPGDDSSGNCIAITSLSLSLAQRIGEFRSEKSIDILEEAIRALERCELSSNSGLLNRSPTKLGDQEGWDDYVLLLSAMGNSGLAEPICARVLEHGKTNFICYDNVNAQMPKFQAIFSKAFFGRYPQFWAHAKIANGEMPFIFWRLTWAIGVALSGLSTDVTTTILNHEMIRTMAHDSDICTLGASVWSFLKRDCNMRTMVALWLSCEQDNGKSLPNWDHPTVRYWRD